MVLNSMDFLSALQRGEGKDICQNANSFLWEMEFTGNFYLFLCSSLYHSFFYKMFKT